MIQVIKGDIFEYKDQGYIINPINDQGIMGKGLSLSFRKKMPDHFEYVRNLGYNNNISVGQMVFDEQNKVIGFPTKMSWRGKSHISFIKEGLNSLLQDMRAKKIKKVFSPALGCGLGELEWEEVKQAIEEVFNDQEEKMIVVLHENK